MLSTIQVVPTIGELTPGTHLSCLCASEEEHWAVLIPFLRQGLTQGEKVLYLVDAPTVWKVHRDLGDAGLAVEPYLTRGQLGLLTVADACLRGGGFDPDQMIALLRAEAGRALTEGYAALRVAAEMTWAVAGLPGAERLIEYERKLDDWLPASRCLAMCQYDRCRCDPAILLEVLHVHPSVIVGTEGYDNICYLPPGVSLSERPAARLQLWTEMLAERTRTETALRQAEEKYRSMFEHAVEGMYQTTPDGRLLAANPALARMLGYPSPEALMAAISDIAEQLYVTPQRRAEFRRLLDEQGVVQGFEMQILWKDGSVMWVSTSARAVRDAQGTLRYYEGCVVDITARKRAEEELRSSREQLRALAAHLQSVREEERTRIARELHDELGQVLTGLRIDLTRLATQPPADQAALQAEMQARVTSIDATIGWVRRIATELRPGVLDDLGLVAAIQWQAQEFQARTGIQCQFRSAVAGLGLDRELSTALFRICQEALTNVARHAHATGVIIRLSAEEDLLILTVTDDGRGITEQDLARRTSLGLLGMRERASLQGGELTVMGRPGSGTTVTVRMPVRRS